MTENNLVKASGRKNKKLNKLSMCMDAAKVGMRDLFDFNSKVLEVNNEYLERLCRADQPEYDILLENLRLATTEEERAAIRARMAEMKKERDQKDTENKMFFDKQQDRHKHATLQILVYVACVTGVVTYKNRKPLMETAKKLITKE